MPWAAGRDTGSFATVHFAPGHEPEVVTSEIPGRERFRTGRTDDKDEQQP